MDFDLSADQAALQEGARDLLDGYASPAQVREHVESGEAYDLKLWQAMAEQGWCAVAVPEDQGGLGMSWIEVAVLLSEVGRHATPVPLLPTLMALAALTRNGEHPAVVEALAGGTSIGAVAWTSKADAVTVSGEGSVTLSGRLGPAEGVSVADTLVVIAPQGVYLVDLTAVGRPEREPAMDVTRTLSWVHLDNTPAVQIGSADDATYLSALGAVATSAELLGGADRALELAAEYAKDRIQFGVPIGSFQAVKHRCADMLVDVEGMRSTTWYGAWAVATEEPGWELAAASAKVWCADAAKRVMGSALQVHGGIGFTWEHDLHFFIKRSQFSQNEFGNASYHRALLAELLKTRVLDGSSVI